MSHPIGIGQNGSPANGVLPSVAGSLMIRPLTDAEEAEAVAFIGSDTIDTIFMSGLIRDNGVESPFNRGVFYGCRDVRGRLQGVALIGHATLVEAHNRRVLAAFASLARESTDAHVIVGSQEKVEDFWACFRESGRRPRRICRELFFQQRWPVATLPAVPGLRQATMDDLLHVMAINARMAADESGTNPLESDPIGFRLRLARRIEQGRVWVWIEDGRLFFKADLMAETPNITYLEGVFVHPEECGKGYGLRCMSQLGRILLPHTGALCVLVNEQNKDAQAFFFKAGYRLTGCYDTIFLHPAQPSRATRWQGGLVHE